MKKILFITIVFTALSCQKTINKKEVEKEVYDTEKAFEKMAADSGFAEAFHYFASEKAVIKRGKDSLISGKEGILNYYKQNSKVNATANWTPDFIEVSDCGNLAYSYGKYVWKVKKDTTETESKGIYLTIWKRQDDGNWKYVWD